MSDKKRQWVVQLAISVASGLIVIIVSPLALSLSDYITDLEILPAESSLSNILILVVGVGSWVALSFLITYFSRTGIVFSPAHHLAAMLCMLILYVPLVRRGDQITDLIHRQVNALEMAKVSSKRTHLHRAIRRAFLPYDLDPNLKLRFTDRGHDYSKLTISFYEHGNSGISYYDVDGVTLEYSENPFIRLPLATNVELPFANEEYLAVTDLTDGRNTPVEFSIEEVGTEFKSYLYELRFKNFPGDFRYSRLFAHPNSQGFNPEAFLLFLDFMQGEIKNVTVHLFADEPIAHAYLVEPGSFDESVGRYAWHQVDFLSGGPLSSEEIAQVLPEALPNRQEVSAGFSFVLDASEGLNRRMVLVYFKGGLVPTQFLGESG